MRSHRFSRRAPSSAAHVRELPVREPAPSGYLRPRIDRLGTLAELTQGGDFGPDDGLGGAGDEGSL